MIPALGPAHPAYGIRPLIQSEKAGMIDPSARLHAHRSRKRDGLKSVHHGGEVMTCRLMAEGHCLSAAMRSISPAQLI
jgi:glycerol-3-phosphate dehydrogenase